VHAPLSRNFCSLIRRSERGKRFFAVSRSFVNWFFVIFQIIRCDTVAGGVLLLNLIALIRSCKISEFPCKGSSLCLPLDKYCDGIDHCGDLSDEPKFCTGECDDKAPTRP
jgi:Low-density lipoprotein receptor domain class A